MQEKVKQVFEKIKEKWNALSKRVKGLLIAGCVLLVVLVATVAVVIANQPYVTLFTGLNTSDMATVVSYLSENGVTDYRISGDDTILVPENMEAQLRANLLMADYPDSGFGYETYLNNVGSLTTEAERQQLTKMELQDRLAATIRCLEGVKDAVVNIAPEENNSFVLSPNNTTEASASVMVILNGNKMLSDNQAIAIRTLMHKAVKGLSIDNVSIVDSNGNTYSGISSDGGVQDASELKIYLEEKQNNLARTSILQILTPLFGEQNVRVSVRTTVNVDRKFVDSTNYSTESWAEDGSTGGRGIIGTQIYDQQVVRGEDGATGGVVGTQTNSDLSTYVENAMQTDGTEEVVGNYGETQYLVDREDTQVEHLSGVVTDMFISVTINRAVLNGMDTETLVTHVAKAAGIGSEIQDEKISILAQDFYEEPVVPIVETGVMAYLRTLPDWVIYAGIAGIALFLILLLIIISVSRRRKKKKRLLEQQRLEAEARLAAQMAQQQQIPQVPTEEAPPTEGADVMEMETEKSMELRKEVRKFAEMSPEIAAQVIRNWLREGED